MKDLVTTDRAPLALPDNGSLTRATTDVEAVAGFLSRYADTPHTLNSYSRETERLLMWLRWRGLELRAITVEDAVAYQAFLLDPLPRTLWCSQPEPKLIDGQPNPAWRHVRPAARKRADGSLNPDWRPFTSELSPASQKLSLSIIGVMMSYLVSVGYLHANAFVPSRRRQLRQQIRIDRYLPPESWQRVLEHLKKLPSDSPRAAANRARLLFVIRFLHLTGLRREELCKAQQSHLVTIRGQVWLKVLGKGSRQGEIPLNLSALAVLREYRASLCLPEWSPGPLLRDVTGKRGIGVKGLHRLIKGFFSSSEDPIVQKASCHWLRHGAASSMLAAGVSLLNVQKALRHSNISTTSLYLHADRDQQALEMERFKL